MASADLTSIYPTIILAIVAFYGAVLSTINFLNERKKEKPNIVVDLFWAWEENDFGGEVLYAIAKNIGSKTVTLDYVIIDEYTKTKKIWNLWITPTDKEKPLRKAHFRIKSDNELSSGKRYEFIIDTETLGIEHGIDTSMNLIATFGDQIGNRYQSKPIEPVIFNYL
jgi:hypothetical protein